VTQTILIVDDSDVVIKLVEMQLTTAGYQVISARDGASGLQLAKTNKPDLVILDVEMPEMDGYEVCRQMRQLYVTHNIPIIMLTALSNIANLEAGYAAGADDYISKPFRPIELQMHVNSILRQTAKANEGSFSQLENHTIAVFSLRGGAGCSSLATNLAVGLSQMWNTNAILLDLVLPTGTCDVMLDMHPTHNLSTLIRNHINNFDEDVIQAHLRACTERSETSQAPGHNQRHGGINKGLAGLR
jgi:pilus assembly protein CpaE